MAQNNTEGAYARGLYNWIHSSGDAELAFAFYQQVFEMELAHSTFATNAAANTPPPPIRSKAQAGSDALVWDLTNTHGSRYRTVFMHADNLSYGLELSEFFDIPRAHRPANPWDPGSSAIVLYVRDLDTIVFRLRAFGAPVVTLGGEPVTTASGRTIVVRDPDGYLVQVSQASPKELANAAGDDAVINSTIRISVSDMAQTLVYYRDLLGFSVQGTRQVSGNDLTVFGLADGAMSETLTMIEGTSIDVLFSEFTLPDDALISANAFNWQLQDVGSPQFQLQVRDLDELLAATKARGYRFLSVDDQPIQRPFGRFVFAKDPDSVLVEYVEPR